MLQEIPKLDLKKVFDIIVSDVLFDNNVADFSFHAYERLESHCSKKLLIVNIQDSYWHTSNILILHGSIAGFYFFLSTSILWHCN